MRTDAPLNRGWTFRDGWEPGWASAPLGGEAVELPHTAVELPLSYFDETSYQRPFTYQVALDWQAGWEGQEVVLLLEGAMADSHAWVNGAEAGRHRDGYTPFEVRLTPHLREGTNLVTLRIDGSENPEIPPFGGQIDYLTYAGIYREARLIVRPRLWIDAVKVETPAPLAPAKTVAARVWLGGEGQGARVAARLLDACGRTVAQAEGTVRDGEARIALADLDLALWSPEAPTLYHLEVTLESDAGPDRVTERFGVREARWTPDGFVLNGQPLKLIGLNRHQSFPYSGYAQGAKSQRRDAELLLELGCNIMRTSHYPQSRHVLDACDELGLLVFEEIPGWQHIGGEAWKAESVENVRRMIRRDWNRPSVVIWGVRINESQDDHAFYARTNRVAREMDGTRATGGVRYITESELLEDVYTMNDFVLGEFENPMANRPRMGLRPKAETTGLRRSVPYLVTEYNGHMFPTKAGDPEQRMAEHAIRHLEVLDAMYGDPGISGAIGWCFFDYNTHKDFGSGDRICHHGVATIFREPKFAAHAYASQQSPESRIVMEPATYYARGERNIGGILPLLVLTNCDEVEVRYGPGGASGIAKRVGPDRERFPHLPHAPVILDHRHFTRDEMGAWGMSWEDAEVIGYLGGREVARRRLVADPLPTTLEVAPDATTLSAEDRDEVRVIVRALDQAGNVLPHLADAARIAVDGPARLIGPPTAYLKGGTTGFWLRATGGTGAVRVTVESDRFPPVTLTLSAE